MYACMYVCYWCNGRVPWLLRFFKNVYKAGEITYTFRVLMRNLSFLSFFRWTQQPVCVAVWYLWRNLNQGVNHTWLTSRCHSHLTDIKVMAPSRCQSHLTDIKVSITPDWHLGDGTIKVSITPDWHQGVIHTWLTSRWWHHWFFYATLAESIFLVGISTYKLN